MNNNKLHGYSWDYLAFTMRPITECSVNMRKELHERWNDLREKIDDNRVTDLFDNFQRAGDYAHYEFYGEITDKLVELLGREPTAYDIIMIIDNGFHHFGATCAINGRQFHGKVNTD